MQGAFKWNNVEPFINNNVAILMISKTNNVNVTLIGDFNVERNESKMSDFLNIYNLKNLVKAKKSLQEFRGTF